MLPKCHRLACHICLFCKNLIVLGPHKSKLKIQEKFELKCPYQDPEIIKRKLKGYSGFVLCREVIVLWRVKQ